MKSFLLLTFCLLCLNLNAAYRYVGGDISLLPDYEEADARYLDHDGAPIADLIPWLGSEGMNAMRVRLFVNPDDYTGADRDPNACQDLDYIIPLCRRIKDAGMALMLDFHYSDTWADPAKQWTPAAWTSLSDSELSRTIHDYTRSCLLSLANEGIVPDFIQTGNEISYGMLWGAHGSAETDLKKTFMGSQANWDRLEALLSSAISACREVCPEAGIVLHTERVATIDVQDNFYSEMERMEVDYDIIGLSYYPYFHGKLTQLDRAVSSLEEKFPSKKIMVVETGYAYKWEVPGTSEPVAYPYSDAGQDQFAKDLVAMLRTHENVTGLFWWWLEYNAFGTSLSNWYNAPLFDSTTGRACSALKTLCSFANGNAAAPEIAADDADGRWFSISGLPVSDPTAPGLYVGRGGKRLVK